MAMQTKKPVMISARERGPGPGRYGLPTTCGYVGHDFTKHMKPAHTFGLKLSTKAYHIGPGPAYAVDPRFTRNGKDGYPQYTMLARPTDVKSFNPPGPGAYSPENCHPQGEAIAPKYSMAMRTRYRKRDGNPAPNTYTLPRVVGAHLVDKRSGPDYTMVKRNERGSYLEDLAKTPGPCGYNDTSADLVKDRNPIYTMLARNFPPGDTTLKPGPGAHYPENVKLHKPMEPHFSMGIRHSEYLCPLIVEVEDD